MKFGSVCLAFFLWWYISVRETKSTIHFNLHVPFFRFTGSNTSTVTLNRNPILTKCVSVYTYHTRAKKWLLFLRNMIQIHWTVAHDTTRAEENKPPIFYTTPKAMNWMCMCIFFSATFGSSKYLLGFKFIYLHSIWIWFQFHIIGDTCCKANQENLHLVHENLLFELELEITKQTKAMAFEYTHTNTRKRNKTIEPHC